MYPTVHAQKFPDKPAYIMAESGEVVTYGRLDARSCRIAWYLYGLGLRPGDGIALCMENHPCFFEICWAAQRSGLYYTAISSRLTTAEMEYIVNDCGATVFFTSAAKADIARRIEAPGLIGRISVDAGVDGFDSMLDVIRAMPAEPLDNETEGADMLYSSGTTGRPKGVKPPLSGKPIGSPQALLLMLSVMYGMDENSSYLSTAPLYHAAPLRFNMAFHRVGCTCVVMERFDPLGALALIEKHGITHSQWVPTMFVRMLKLDAAERERYDVSSLRAAIHAAAPCPVPVKQQMIDWWGPVIYEYYGGTEGNGLTALDSDEWLAHKGSVGKPVLGEIHIIDDEGNELPTGEAGNVYFGGGGSFEYHNDPEKTAKSRNEKGWSTLGDVGYVDEDGFLYLTDRKANMIITGGVNVYPQEAENVMVTHPKVADVAVFGIPNEEFGEEVKAVVQPLDMADAGEELAEELIAFCREQLAAVKCPRSVDFEAALPRHPTGKLYKRLLKDRYWTDHESRII